MSKPQLLERFLRTIVEAIAKKTPSPVIEHIEKEALFRLQVDGQDQGRFVGKGGAHIFSIQTLFWYAGLAHFGYSYSVKLLEPEVPRQDRRPQPFCFRPTWDREKIKTLTNGTIAACLPCHASCEIEEQNETTAIAHLKIQKYLQCTMGDPPFVEAFSTIVRVAGMSQGANIKTEAIFT